jgi:hypothetical protein
MRIATFNLENLSGDKPASPLEERLLILRPQLERLRAEALSCVDGGSYLARVSLS